MSVNNLFNNSSTIVTINASNDLTSSTADDSEQSAYSLLPAKSISVAFQAVGSACCLICFPLYMFLWFVIVAQMYKSRGRRSAKFYTPYYLIIASKGVADIVSGVTWAVAIYPFFRPPVPGWFDTAAERLEKFDPLLWHSVGNHIWLVSFYRFVGVQFPTSTATLFSMNKTCIYVGVAWLVAFCYNLPAIIVYELNPLPSWRPDDCFMGWDMSRTRAVQVYQSIGYVEVFIIVSVLVMYLASIGKLYVNRTKFRCRGRRSNRFEVSLTIQQLIVFVCYSVSSLFWKFTDQLIASGANICILGYWVLTCTISLNWYNPLIYLATNSELRKACRAVIKDHQTYPSTVPKRALGQDV